MADAGTGSFRQAFASIGVGGTGSATGTTGTSAPVSFTSPLSTFQGTGTYTFDWLSSGVYGGGPGEFLNTLNLTGGTVTATYTYSPVPEPATTFFGLACLGALGLRRQRRRSEMPSAA